MKLLPRHDKLIRDNADNFIQMWRSSDIAEHINRVIWFVNMVDDIIGTDLYQDYSHSIMRNYEKYEDYDNGENDDNYIYNVIFVKIRGMINLRL